MRIFLAIILISIFFISCHEKKENSNDKDIISFADTEESASDFDTESVIPDCADEWEQTDLVEDVSKIFDFKIITKTGTWKFEKNGNYEKFVVDRNFFPFHISENGTIFASSRGGTHEVEEGVSFLQVLKPDGTLIEYIAAFEKGEVLAIGNSKSNTYLTSMAFYDETKKDIYVTLNMRSTIKDEITEEYIIKPFVAVMNENENFSYRSWKFDGNSMCTFPKFEDGKIFLTCMNWSSIPEIYAQSGGTNAEMIIIDGKTVYRKVIQSELEDRMVSFSSDSDTTYSYFRGYGDAISDTIFEITKNNLCFRERDYSKYFLTNYFIIKYGGLQPFLLMKMNNTPIFLNYYQKWVYGEEISWQTIVTGLYFNFNDRETLISFGNDTTQQIVGDSAIYQVASPGDLFIEGNKVYLTGVSSFDIEDKGRDWITEEILETSSQAEQPFIAVVNMETMEVYVKQFFTEFDENRYGFIYINDKYIYYEGHGVIPDSNGQIERILYRIPKSWLINEDSMAKETRVWIQEKKPLKELKPMVDVSAGSYHTCALDEENMTICWGQNTEGQLGNSVGEIDKEDATRITNPYPDIIDLNEELRGKKVVSISSGAKYATISVQGSVYCWGDGGFGQLGYGGNNNKIYPTAVKTDGVLKDKEISDLAPGLNHTCAIDNEGNGYCWGQNLLGNAGCGSEDQIIPEPVAVDMSGVLKDRKIIEISSGSGHTCSVADDGGVYCWGLNDRGQLGDGKGGTQGGIGGGLGDLSRVPVKAETAEGKYVKVSAGYSHTCILSDAGKIYCFGENKNGQLGDGTTEMRLTPVALNSNKVFKSVSAGFEHTCAVDNKDEAYCWGGNIVGQLGTGNKESSLIPVKVKYATETKIKSISCGHRHTCSVNDSGIVHCWGWNQDGQLGNGTYEDSLTPKEIKTKE